MNLSRITFLILLSLLLSIVEYAFLPYTRGFTKNLLLVYTISLVAFEYSTLQDSMIIGVAGGLFESLLGVNVLGFYSLFYCGMVFILFMIKKHTTSSPIVLVFPYLISLCIYFLYFLHLSVANLFWALLSNALFTGILFVVGLKIHEKRASI